MTEIADNLQNIRQRIARAAVVSGRAPGDVKLLAISKSFPIDRISEAIAAGQRRFGENRVQEAEQKISHFREFPDIEWHLVGHLQTNKARRAAQLFKVIHSLDSIRLAEKLTQAGLELGNVVSVLLEVNLAKEQTKSGADRSEVREIVAASAQFPGIRLDGLMTIPPFSEDPGAARPFFAELRGLRDQLEEEHPGCLGERQLSMGMSRDFEVAIEEGATLVRIGTAIFGKREDG